MQDFINCEASICTIFNLVYSQDELVSQEINPNDSYKLIAEKLFSSIVCGILAALMSSLASLFNSSAMLFTIDFYKKYRPKASEKTLLYVGRVATVVVVVLGILWIPVMKSVGSVLYNYLQDVQSVLAKRNSLPP